MKQLDWIPRMGILVLHGENGKKSIGKDGWGLVGSLAAWLFTLVKPQKFRSAPSVSQLWKLNQCPRGDHIREGQLILRVSQAVLVVKNLPFNAGHTEDTSSIPALRRSPVRGNATHSSILAWEIPWTEETDRL